MLRHAAPRSDMLLIALLAISATAPALRAQQIRPLPNAGPGIIAGVVTDTNGRGLEGASVYLTDRKREVRTGRDGAFRFIGLRTGDTLLLVARKIGYFPVSERVPLGPEGGRLMVQLQDRPVALPAVVTHATNSGLTGLVSNIVSTPLPNATIQVIGAGMIETKSDSTGRFAVPLKPGHYMLRVTRGEHIGQMVGVTVPAAGGRSVTIQLMPGRDPYQSREAAYAWDLKDRLMFRSEAWSKVYTREDIRAMNELDLTAIASAGAARQMDKDCQVVINGGMTSAPLWSLDVDEIEFLEVYTRLPTSGVNVRRPRSAANRNSARGLSQEQRNAGAGASMGIRGGRCPAAVIAWTAK